jgi:hypothetical protein
LAKNITGSDRHGSFLWYGIYYDHKKFYSTGRLSLFQLSGFVAFKTEEGLNEDSRHGFQNISISFPPGVNVKEPLWFITAGCIKIS